MMKRLLFSFGLASWFATSMLAQGPRLLPFQGRLTDAQGNGVPDGARLIQFQIYGDPVGGNALWAGEAHRTTVNGGLVNVMLGSKNPLPKDRSDNPSRSFFDGTLYLQITVDTSGPSGVPDGQITAADPPLLPRQAILPVIFASESALSRNSQKLNGYDWSALLLSGANSNNPVAGQIDGTKLGPGTLPGDRLASASITAGQIAPGAVGFMQLALSSVQTPSIGDGQITSSKLSPDVSSSLVPPGAIEAFGGTNIPAGWLSCDGKAVNSRQYSRLFAAIGTSWGFGTLAVGGTNDFNLPDLRGLFIRGVNGTRTNFTQTGTNFVDPDVLLRTNGLSGGNSGNAIGSIQLDSLALHTHQVDDHFTDSYSGRNGRWYTAGQTVADNSHPTSTQSAVMPNTETRPKNAYVNYIIKF